MKRLFSIFVAATILLISCGQTSSLWGTYATPTSEASDPPPFIPTLPADTATFTPLPLPTSTFTSTPTLSALQSSTPPSTSGTGIESTFTPTFDVPSVLYYAQSGDTLAALAARFNVDPSEVRADAPLPKTALINPGTLLVIPDRITQQTTPNIQIIPDSELVFSATGADFDIASYVRDANGKLASYSEYLGSTGWTGGADIIKRIAYENSINPRLLLGILDYESRWVRGQPADILRADYPMGFENVLDRGLFSQLVWAADQLSIGYYGWRDGTVTELSFRDGAKLRIDPRLNAGTVAIQYLFAKLHSQSQWAQMMDPGNGFLAFYTQMFGDAWARGNTVNPIFPPGLIQPELVLPFEPNIIWNLTGGPHGAFDSDGSQAALDLAPATDKGGCDPTPTWAVASAPGLVVRSDTGVLVIDLDGDGNEQTGWALVYLHIGTKDRLPVGTWVKTNDKVGHASCEGGRSTGTHIHIVRKYNGEWVAADGPIPFVLSGWTAHAGSKPYEGTMTKGDQTVIADPVGQRKSVIIREPNE